MICKIGKRKKDFAQIRNLTLRDSRLSVGGTAVLVFLLSYPDDWEIKMEHLCGRFHKSKSYMSRIFRELSELGYAVLYSVPGERGTWRGRQYVIHEEPRPESETRTINNTAKNGRSADTSFRTRSAKSVLSTNTYKDSSGKKDSLRSSSLPATDCFFPLNGNVSPFIKKACAILENYVRRIKRLDRRFNRQTWHEEMRLLLQDIKGDKRRLKRVLMGYISTPSDKWKSQVECARSFRRKFFNIEKWLGEEAPPEVIRRPVRMPDGTMQDVTHYVFSEDEGTPKWTSRCINPK